PRTRWLRSHERRPTPTRRTMDGATTEGTQVAGELTARIERSALLGRDAGWIRPHASKLALALRLTDVVLIVGLHQLACALYSSPFSTLHVVASFAGVITFQLIAEANGLYSAWRGAPVRIELQRILAAWLITL